VAPDFAAFHPRAVAAAQTAAVTCGVLGRGENNSSQESQDRSTRTPASQLVVLISTTPPRSSEPLQHRMCSVSRESNNTPFFLRQLTGT
jgi:hypothetical protein